MTLIIIAMLGPIVGYVAAHYVTWWVGQIKHNQLRSKYELPERQFTWRMNG